MSEIGGWPFVIPIVAIIGGFFLAGLSIYAQIRRREFEHRERLAMIEKGLTPPPATKPLAEEMLPTHSDVWQGPGDSRKARTRGGGFILMAVGFGLAFMMWMTTHDEGVAVGVGGFLVILGAAIFLSAFFHSDGRGKVGTPDGSRH